MLMVTFSATQENNRAIAAAYSELDRITREERGGGEARGIKKSCQYCRVAESMKRGRKTKQ